MRRPPFPALTQHKKRRDDVGRLPLIEQWVYACSQSARSAGGVLQSLREESIVRSIHVVAAALLALVAAAASAQAPDPNLARNLAATCANCHGTGGVSQGGTESLAGMPKDTMLRKMQEFRTGNKPATIMHQLSKGYTEEQIALIAGWFAEQKVAK
jgi:cytochrome subunit of sulfide dehydrogenase